MKYIKNFNKYIVESISGTEFTGEIPGNGVPHTTQYSGLSQMKSEFLSDKNGNIYSYEDYLDLYNEYLKKMGPPIEGGFTQNNIDIINQFLNKKDDLPAS